MHRVFMCEGKNMTCDDSFSTADDRFSTLPFRHRSHTYAGGGRASTYRPFNVCIDGQYCHH